MAIYTHNEILNSPTATWIESTATITSVTDTQAIFTNSDGTLTVLIGNGLAATGDTLSAGTITAAERRDASNIITYESITNFTVTATQFTTAFATGGLQGFASEILNGADTLNGFSGNDTFEGFAGSDTIVGNGGADTIVYSGLRADYAITYNAPSQTFTVVDTRALSPDGTDAVRNVSGGSFQFGDGTTITAASLISAVNRAPDITSAPIVTSVSEDGTTVASGTLTATDPDGNAPLLWSVVGATVTGADYLFTMDSFSVDRIGVFSFTDSFNDATPPSGAAGDALGVNGTFAESGDRLVFSSANAVPLTAPGTPDPFTGQGAVFRTNINPTVLNQGLKSNASFTVEGVFDLSNLPDTPREGFGIRLSDRLEGGTGNPPDQAGDDTIELDVFEAPNGTLVVRLFDRNFVTDTTTVLGSIALVPPIGADQIRLRLSHDASAVGVVHASFDYLDGGVTIATQSFSAVGHIFGTDTPTTADDENWTRAGFLAFAPQQGDSSLSGTYGTLSVDQAGHWDYALANSQANVQALAQGEQATDTFQVRVSDGTGSPSGITTQTVTVNVTGTNDAPTAVTLSNASVAENSAGSIVVGNLSALDVDHGAAATFTLIDSAGGRFAIVGNQLVVANGASIDFEQIQTHDVTIRADDGLGGMVDTTLTIAVTDIFPEVVTSGAGDATIVTGIGNDTVTTGAGNDVVQTGAGNDAVTAGDGNDVVQTGTGSDTIVGGTGNGDDVYDAGADTDTVVYSSATSSISVDLQALDRSAQPTSSGGTIGALLEGAGFPATTLVGKAEGIDIGTDALIGIENVVGGHGDDTLTGDQNANALTGAGGNDTIDGGAGSDTLIMSGNRLQYAVAGTAADFSIVDSNASRDGTDSAHNIEFVQFLGGVRVAVGDLIPAAGPTPITNGNAGGVVTGTAGDDVFATAGGADIVNAGRGNDKVDAGSGNDVVNAGDGNDTIVASAGDGADLYFGGDGTDTYDLSQITSALNVDLGVTRFGHTINGVGGASGSQIGTDALTSIENIIGGSGKDKISGDDLANALSGGAGNDTISGGGGNDRIEGGAGNDTLNGGAGSDTFVFKPGFGKDIVTDFQIGGTTAASNHDTLDLRGLAFTSVTDLLNHIDLGANAVIHAGSDTITLQGVTKAQLQSHAFDLLIA